MAPPPVFASYAQLDRDKHLEKFIEVFRDELRSLTAHPDAVALAFFDRDGVDAGDEWSETILTAVNSARVLVCLMSPTYFTREWCGRELEAFRRRVERLAPPTAVSFVFPVWWQLPVTPRPIPTRLARFNYRDAAYPREYETHGLRGLARRGQWTKFRTVADRLAQVIAATLQQPVQLPAGVPINDILDIDNAFDEQQPFDVRVVVNAPGGDAWRPSAADSTISEAIQQTARQLAVFHRKLDTGAGLNDAVDHAVRDQQIILVIADPATPPDVTLLGLNRHNAPRTALLLVDIGVQQIGVDAWLAQFGAGSFADAKSAGLVRVAGIGEAQAQMERLVDDARRKARTAIPAIAAKDAELLQQAKADGIDPTTVANLSGPSAEGSP